MTALRGIRREPDYAEAKAATTYGSSPYPLVYSRYPNYSPKVHDDAESLFRWRESISFRQFSYENFDSRYFSAACCLLREGPAYPRRAFFLSACRASLRVGEARMILNFPIVHCPKCGKRMSISSVETTASGHVVNYECVSCETRESQTVPHPLPNK